MVDQKPEGLREPTRIEGQYLQAAMQFWTNLNTVNWQRLLAILVLQSTSLSAAYAQRPSWVSVLILVLSLLVSLVPILQIISDQRLRTHLTRQTNYLSARLLAPLFENQEIPKGLTTPFLLYD